MRPGLQTRDLVTKLLVSPSVWAQKGWSVLLQVGKLPDPHGSRNGAIQWSGPQRRRVQRVKQAVLMTDSRWW